MAAKNIKWYKVFDSVQEAREDIPENRIIKVLLNNKYVCFTKSGDDFFAFGDTCPHQGKPMIQGECTIHNTVKCPFHQYEFDLKTGRGHGLYLPVYPVEIREGAIYVGVERSPWQFF